MTGEGFGPIDGLYVRIVDNSTGFPVTFAQTNMAGVFTATSLQPGNYRVYTDDPTGDWVNEIYSNITCYVYCEIPLTGGSVVSVGSSTASGIDFDLAVGGSISGTLTDGITLNPLQGFLVMLHLPNGSAASGGTDLSDAMGAFTLGGIPAGTYLVSTQTPPGYLNEVYNDVVCPNNTCTASFVMTNGTPIPVASGQDVTGIDIALTEGGKITGTVTNAVTMAPISGASVRVFRSNGVAATTVTTNPMGVYTATGLTTGTYRAAAIGPGGAYQNEIYDNVECAPQNQCLGGQATAMGTAIGVTAGVTTSGKDFALEPLGAVSGTVLRASDNTPLAGVPVFVLKLDGEPAGQSVETDGSGVYTFPGLKTGTYYVITEAQTGGYVNEVYNNIPCNQCSLQDVNPTPVSVTAPATTPNIDFSLDQTGEIKGMLRDEVTLQPLRGFVIAVPQGVGNQVFAFANLGAGYSLSGLEPGNYFLLASSNGYFTELYNNVRCPDGNCQVFQVGTPTALVLGSTVTRDFNLSRAGQITGIVTDATTSAPIAGIKVRAVNAQGQAVTTVFTSQDGSYALSQLEAGTYYLYTLESTDYVHEYWNDRPCLVEACNNAQAPARGDPVSVSDGQTTAARDFALVKLSRVTGTVTDGATGAPLENVTVIAVHPRTDFSASTTTDANGAYTIELPKTGAYFLYTNAAGRLNEVHDNIACPGACGSRNFVGAPIVILTPGTSVTGKDFALDRGATLSGRVISAATGDGLPSVQIDAVDSSGQYSFRSFTNAAGQFTFPAMNPGSYVFYTDAQFSGYKNEIYKDVPCDARCSASAALRRGTRIPLTDGATVSGITIELSIGGRITGTVTDAGTGAPIANLRIRAVRKQPLGFESAGSATTSASGEYSVKGLSAGTYYILTEGFTDYINEVYPDISCAGVCEDGHPLLGAPITVVEGTGAGGIDLALTRGGQIAGQITDARTLLELAGTVLVYSTEGRLVAFAQTSDGTFVTIPGLPSGIYHVSAEAPAYYSELYDNVPCQGHCQPRLATGTPVSITAGSTTSGIDFALDLGGFIYGAVTREDNLLPVANAQLTFYNPAGYVVGYGFTETTGDYMSTPLAPGTYYAVTNFTRDLIEERFNNMPCAGECSIPEILGGTPITVPGNFGTPGIDFALAPDSGVPGPPVSVNAANDERGVVITWIPSFGGGPATSYIVEAGLTPGGAGLTVPATETTLIVPSVPPATYYIRVRGVNGAGTGPPSRELVLTVGGGGVVAPQPPVQVTAVMIGRRLMLSWGTAARSAAPTEWVVQAGTSSGASDIATITVTAPVFTYEPVPDGFYFLRVRARNAAGTSAASAESLLVVGGVPAPPLAPALYSADVAGSALALHWDAPYGPVSGYLIEAGSAPGLSDLATVPRGPETTFSVSGIPSGTYYVRVRAFNAQGSSTPSNTITVVIP